MEIQSQMKAISNQVKEPKIAIAAAGMLRLDTTPMDQFIVDFWLGDDQRHMIIAGDSLWNAYLKDNPDAHP
ncbi:hypothetical protein NC652_030718 [Populus alba x Populus x berolinensis]|nr:hypothetical protein NC652_030718 [Populus alba x Populus x berolinensis]